MTRRLKKGGLTICGSAQIIPDASMKSGDREHFIFARVSYSKPSKQDGNLFGSYTQKAAHVSDGWRRIGRSQSSACFWTLSPTCACAARTHAAGRAQQQGARLVYAVRRGRGGCRDKGVPQLGHTHTPVAPPRKHALSLADNAVAFFTSNQQHTSHRRGNAFIQSGPLEKKRADPEVYRQTAASRRIARLERFDHAAKSAQIAGRFYCAANMCEALPERMADAYVVSLHYTRRLATIAF